MDLQRQTFELRTYQTDRELLGQTVRNWPFGGELGVRFDFLNPEFERELISYTQDEAADQDPGTISHVQCEITSQKRLDFVVNEIRDIQDVLDA